MATIDKIDLVAGLSVPDSYTSFEGAVIYLSDGETIKILIDDQQSCCETAGYAVAEDNNIEDFVGAEFTSLELISSETAERVNKVLGSTLYEVDDLDAGDIAFININTSKGTLQFSVYNEHNGYYGHQVLVTHGSKEILNDCF